MPASDTIKQPVSRYQVVSTRRSTPQQLPCPVIPLAVARIGQMVSDPIHMPFHMYGEGQPNTSLYPKLKEAVLRGDKVFNMSGGEQLRDYDYLPVEKADRQIVRLAMAQHDIGAVNICSGKPISVRRLVEQWLDENNWKIELNLSHYPYPDYESMAFWGEPLPKNAFPKTMKASGNI